MQRGGVKTHGFGEQMREEAGDLAQERTLGLHATKLLEEGEGHRPRGPRAGRALGGTASKEVKA
jgi:hypothetical protein